MTIPHLIILFIAAVLGGTINSVAGGGSFFTFPTLILAGVPAIQSNATSTVALWPGSVASASAYWYELSKQKRSILIVLISTSLFGGILGALLLLHTSQTIFIHLIPYLLLMATLLFIFSGPITARLHMRKVGKAHSSWRTLLRAAVVQLVIAIYGGYFGGGAGILMLASSLALIGMDNIHEMNALKALLVACINAVAIVIFIIKGIIVWPQALLMAVGASIGGYAGAHYARRIDPKWIRAFVIVVGFSLTIYFFVRPQGL